MYDVLLRVEHSVGGSEGARRAISAITSTGKNIGTVLLAIIETSDLMVFYRLYKEAHHLGYEFKN